MTDSISIPEPIVFNPLKHHKDYITTFMKNATPGDIKDHFDSICLNYIDIYTGKLSIEDITNQVVKILKDSNVFEKEKFQKWIKSSNKFQLITLSDHSNWIIREGKEIDRYIHIHPAKSGEHTVRFKGATLKTAYQLKMQHTPAYKPKLEDVNNARKKIGLSPVKKLEKGKGIYRCWEFTSRW